MTQVVWDDVGTRRFEIGLERGVLYPRDAPGVPWNGLVAVDEVRSGEIQSVYQDGIRYLYYQIPGSYAAKLRAFTYPDELDALVGAPDWQAPGLQLHDQRGGGLFGLSYRTRVGNDLEGIGLGYRLHLIYNVAAAPSDFSYDTIDSGINVSPLEWNLAGLPDTSMASIRPTAHLSLDSRRVTPELLAAVEALIYGTSETDPALPDLSELSAMGLELG